LFLTFRGTDSDVGLDGEAASGAGQFRYYSQLKPLIDEVEQIASARSFEKDGVSYQIDKVVVSGHSLGGAMADIFALSDGRGFANNIDLQVYSVASAGVDHHTLLDYGDVLGINSNSTEFDFDIPDYYFSISNQDDLVRNPDVLYKATDFFYDQELNDWQWTDYDSEMLGLGSEVAGMQLFGHANLLQPSIEFYMPYLGQFKIHEEGLYESMNLAF
jgi:hypothetical protein